MSKGSPSMVALLGLLAVAGYKNRDRLSGLLQPGAGRDSDGLAPFGTSDRQAGGGLLDGLRQNLQTGGGGLLGGLSELIGRFANPVQAAKAESWVGTGPNGQLGTDDMDGVLDEETIADLMQTTGLSRYDLMERLSDVLPDAVDQLTPNGRLPTPQEAQDIYQGQRA